MAVPFDDARVRGGDNDPLVTNPTPGCVVRFRPTGILIQGTTFTLIQSSVAARRLAERIPPVWVSGTANNYLGYLLIGDLSITLALAASAFAGNDGRTAVGGDVPSSRSLTADAIAGWGVAVYDGGGNVAYFRLSDVNAAQIVPGNPYGASIDAVGRATLSNADNAGWTIVVVDINHPNVDWDDREFISIRAGAGFNLGNDRALRALTAGPLWLVLHGGSPTTANRLTGGGYVDVPVTGPAGWNLSTEGGDRVIQTLMASAFGTASNVWTRATHLALWTGAAATGDLVWHDSILAFTARTGGMPNIPPAALKIGLPNLG